MLSDNSKICCVLGANGFLGKHVVDSLLHHGHFDTIRVTDANVASAYLERLYERDDNTKIRVEYKLTNVCNYSDVVSAV